MAETVKLSEFALDGSNLANSFVISIAGTGGGPFTNNRISFTHLKSQITSDLSSIYVTNNALTNTLSSYALQSWVTGQNYITSSALTGYATEEWVNTKSWSGDENWRSHVVGTIEEEALVAVNGPSSYQQITNPGATLTFELSSAVVDVSANADITAIVVQNGNELKQNRVSLVIYNSHASNTITVDLTNVSPNGLTVGITEPVEIAPQTTEIIDLVLVD